jgi:hypothetical protein
MREPAVGVLQADRLGRVKVRTNAYSAPLAAGLSQSNAIVCRRKRMIQARPC